MSPARRFKPYPAYKDSGVEWLGEIPAHWEVKRLRDIADSLQTGPFGSQLHADDYIFGGRPVINPSNLQGGTLVPDWNCTVDESSLSHLARHELVAGDIVLARRGELGRCALATAEQAGWLCGTGSLRLRLRSYDACPQYFLRLLSTDGVRDWLTLQSVGSTMQNLNTSIIGRIPVAVPMLDEQRCVAAFLDRETARIDALVAKKERLIELLQEKHTTLITRAVTKGLDPNVPMKDSGVEWLGKIPAHWEVKRTKFVARLRSGHTPSRQHPEYWQDCTIPWFGLADVWQIRDGQVEYVSETAEKISELGLASSAARLLPTGTVILSRTASVGFSAIMGVDMATTQDFVNWVCGPELRPEYLLYVFRSMEHEFRRLTMGSTHQTIYMPDVGAFATPVPSTTEQGRIVAYVRSETMHIDALTVKVRDAIDRLKELRTALISAAVTGKIDVRKEAT